MAKTKKAEEKKEVAEVQEVVEEVQEYVTTTPELGAFDSFVEMYRKMCGKLCGQDFPKVAKNPFGRLVAYSKFVVDNYTGGGGGGGLAKVSHDDTMSGDGTVAEPLSVKGEGIRLIFTLDDGSEKTFVFNDIQNN